MASHYFSALMVVFIPEILCASEKVFTISLEKPVGFNSYDLEAPGPDTLIEGTTVRPLVRSELNFPLDPFRLGLGWASYRLGKSTRPTTLKTGVHAWVGLGPAYFKMRDEDWVGTQSQETIGQSQALVKFSDTYSKVTTYQLGMGMERDINQTQLLGIPLTWGIGMGGALLYYDVFGLTGRQRFIDGDSEWLQVSLPSSLKVLIYHNYSGRAYFTSRFKLLNLHWNSQFSPLTFKHSYDDHLLRKKTIEMNCWGGGAKIEASLPIPSHKAGMGHGSRFEPYARAEWEKTWGKMVQTYYADSDDSPEDETGQSMRGIETTVSDWLLAAGLHYHFRY